MNEETDAWGVDMQRVFLSFMVSDPSSFARCRSILQPEYFDDELRAAVRYILQYSDQFRALPTPQQIAASTRVRVEPFDAEETAKHCEWFLTETEKFCRHKALELAILEGAEKLQKGQYGDIEAKIKEAMTISLMADLGTDYFYDPLARIERMRDRSNYVSTGWAVLDQKLYGGFTRGALNVFAGGSGSGKSLFLQNIALNWVFAGLNVVYITLELSEDLVSMRLDSMVTGYGTKDVFRRIDDVALRVKTKGRESGTLTVKKMPEAGTNANKIRAFLKEYEIKTGTKPDALIVDYLDLMHPNNEKIDVTSLFVKDKYTSEEMRAIASEMNLLCVTASQLNRQSVEASDFDHSHIAGGISKINTADNVFGIFTNFTMRERGCYQLQFLKTRSSSAVGQKVDLAYDPVSMRISDPPEGGLDLLKPKDADTLRDEAKKKPAAPPAPQAGKGESAIDVMQKIKARTRGALDN